MYGRLKLELGFAEKDPGLRRLKFARVDFAEVFGH